MSDPEWPGGDPEVLTHSSERGTKTPRSGRAASELEKFILTDQRNKRAMRWVKRAEARLSGIRNPGKTGEGEATQRQPLKGIVGSFEQLHATSEMGSCWQKHKHV